jgi:hypothetical protein
LGAMEASRKVTLALVFSRDRAMQLDATVRSFRRHCFDNEVARIVVLYQATSELHEKGYRMFAHEHPRVTLVHESDFRMDVIDILSEEGLGRRLAGMSRAITTAAPKIMPLLGPWTDIPKDRTVLFLVDDNVFVRHFSLAVVLDCLATQPDVIGFSLRLGTNTTWCYAHDREQQVPPLTQLSNGVVRFDWTLAELDFGYPLEISSSVYRIADVLPVITAIRFSNPNTLEGYFSGWAGRIATNQPYLLAFDSSVTFCNPANKVQVGYEQNRAGESTEHAADRLGELFLQGGRIDIERYDQFLPKGCHEEVELVIKGVAEK